MTKSPAPKPVLDILDPRDLELGPFAVGEARDDASPWKHWRMRTDDDGIAWLLFDKKDASTNTLDDETLTELDAVLDKLERDRPRGLVIRSAKPGGFVAGADIAQFTRITDTAQIEALLTRGHGVLDRLDRLPLPTVAVIHGYCLGGGLELVLACDKRIAIDDASFGFPEILLGLHPGLGGTLRLPHLISPVQAMTMMLTGKTERARRAKSLGLVDAVTQERHVRAAVKAAVSGELKPHQQGMLDRLLDTGPARSLLASRMRSEAAKRAPKKDYPAPYALIDLWVTHGGNRDAMQKEEIASFVAVNLCLPGRSIRSSRSWAARPRLGGKIRFSARWAVHGFSVRATASIVLADYAAGLHAASLVPDGGTLQIGIGSLGDAVTQSLILRHRNNENFRNILSTLGSTASREADVHVAPFASGLYGCSEMFVEGLLDLFRAGVLKREVDGGVLDSGFFVGSCAFYRALREMPDDTLAKIRMRSISFVNELYSGEREKRYARVGARFINDAMMATVLGDVISDGLDDGLIRQRCWRAI